MAVIERRILEVDHQEMQLADLPDDIQRDIKRQEAKLRDKLIARGAAAHAGTDARDVGIELAGALPVSCYCARNRFSPGRGRCRIRRPLHQSRRALTWAMLFQGSRRW